MGTPILRISGICKGFSGVQALDNVSFDIQKGTIHGLVGENGAGKTTLVKILGGAYLPDAGEIILDGKTYIPKNPTHAASNGISVVHQELRLAENLSVMENIFLGHPHTNRLGLIDWRVMKQKAAQLISSLGLSMDPEEPVENLSIAQKQVTEICKALAYNAKVVIMDEPSATLTASEMTNLYRIVKKLRADGVTVIYITHRLEELFEICDEASVLRDGCHIQTQPMARFSRESLISMMVGRELGLEYPKTKVEIGKTALSVRNFSLPGAFKDISFDLKQGEILGFSGLVGAGRTEMARALMGADKGAVGEVILKGGAYQIRDVHHAVKNGLGFLTEDRKGQGLMLGMSVRENTSLVNLEKILHMGILSIAKDVRLAEKYIQALHIATPGPEAEAQHLSGGNQQKVVIAKWLNADCDILIFDEPTRGIDVGAKQEIYRLMCGLAGEGKAILMISSDLPELLGICDRIAVMREGRLAGILDREAANQESVMSLAVS